MTKSAGLLPMVPAQVLPLAAPALFVSLNKEQNACNNSTMSKLFPAAGRKSGGRIRVVQRLQYACTALFDCGTDTRRALSLIMGLYCNQLHCRIAAATMQPYHLPNS